MNDAVKYSVMVVRGTTVHEYAAEASADALPEGSSLADKLVDGRTRSDHDERVSA
jgi:hypothetical protein